MDDLTPYDKGERMVPIPWVGAPGDFTTDMDRDPDDFGRVDFNDDEGSTIATVYMTRLDDGTHVLHIDTHCDNIKIKEN